MHRKALALLAFALTLLMCLPAFADAFCFGESELGRALTCIRLGDENAPNRMLITFAAHGFEDAADRDGQYLCDIAQGVADYYAQNPERLNGYALCIVPCLNPDGLLEGESKDGFGRLNAKGLDINRDFPTGWTRKTTPRNRTGDEPFATAEARALRDLVDAFRPTCAVDVHGWINRVYGSKSLAKPFQKVFGFKHHRYQSGGMLSQWLGEVCADAILLELPNPPTRKNYVPTMTQKLCQALDRWFAGV